MSKSGQAAFWAALVLSSQAALADVTPEEVWQNWQDTATAQGQKVTAANTAMDGDTLTVSGITVEMTGEGGTGSALIGEIKFRDKGDGTVAIITPDSFPVLLTLPPTPGVAGAAASELKLTVTMPGADITASGVPQSLSYATKAPTVEILADVTESGSAEAAKVQAKLSDVTVNYLVEAAESGSNLTEDFAAKTLDFSVQTTGMSEGNGTFALSLSNIGGKVEMTGIPEDGMADMPTALNKGMTLDLDASYGIGTFSLLAEEAGTDIKMAGTLGGGNLALTMDARNFLYDAATKSIALNVESMNPVDFQVDTFSATLATLTSKLEMSGANWSAAGENDAALKAGLKMSAAFALGASSFDFQGTDKTDMSGEAAVRPTTVMASIGGLDTSFAMDAAAMQFDIGTKAVKMTMSSPDLPMPEASVDVTEIAMDFAMPLAKSVAPAPFNLLTKVVDLNVADALWSMVDPGGVLPHDPATLIIDTKGTATLTRDLIEDAMAMAEGAPPGMVNSLDLTQFLFRVAGAEFTAAGAFTFDNTDTTTIPGMPLPTGKIDIKGVGVNGLIDKLVSMGLLPEDQAMQGRMMISMFANSSADKDEITSVLEFKDGHFYANGQQLQ